MFLIHLAALLCVSLPTTCSSPARATDHPRSKRVKHSSLQLFSLSSYLVRNIWQSLPKS